MAQRSQTAELEYLVLALGHLQMLGVLDAVRQEMPMAEHSRSFLVLLLLLLLAPSRLSQLLPQLLQLPLHQLRQPFHWDTLEL